MIGPAVLIHDPEPETPAKKDPETRRAEVTIVTREGPTAIDDETLAFDQKVGQALVHLLAPLEKRIVALENDMRPLRLFYEEGFAEGRERGFKEGVESIQRKIASLNGFGK